MLTIKLYKFSKNKNSTAQPDNSVTQVSYSALMKTASSIINPVLTLKESPIGYNYCYIVDFERYYFINDITYTLGEWELSLSVDSLASFKSDLGSSTALVLRSASNKNGYIKDNLYPLTGNHTKSVQTWSPFPISGTGYFYLMICSKSSTYPIRLTQSDFNDLMDALMAFGGDPNNWTSTEQALQNQTFNPIQYLNSVYWTPVSYTTHAGGVSLYIGNYDTGVPYSVIQNKYETFTHSFTIASHPQVARGIYCNMSPYSEHSISAGGFGHFAVPSDLLTESTNTVDLEICVDTRNGTACLVAMCNGVRFARLNSSVGVEIPVSQASRNIIGGATSLLSGISNFVTGAITGDIAGAMGGALTGINGVIEMNKTNISTTGVLGSLTNLYDDIRLTSVWYDIASADNTNNGSPLCDYVQISTLSGFTLCEKGIFKSSKATESEINEINSYMVSGFYYE